MNAVLVRLDEEAAARFGRDRCYWQWTDAHAHPEWEQWAPPRIVATAGEHLTEAGAFMHAERLASAGFLVAVLKRGGERVHYQPYGQSK